MTDSLSLNGQLTITPDSTSDADLSGDFAVKIALSLGLTLSGKDVVTVDLPADETPNQVVVNVSSVEEIHFLMVRSTIPISLELTGTSIDCPILPCDSLLILNTSTTPVLGLAITYTNIAGGSVRITMGRV